MFRKQQDICTTGKSVRIAQDNLEVPWNCKQLLASGTVKNEPVRGTVSSCAT